jgi:hypothetical protein
VRRDGPRIRAFIDQHWKHGHILARNERLFDWQHLSPDRDGYDFVVADAPDGSLAAILGFIRTSRFDSALAPDGDLWLAIWKVRDELTGAGLGLPLFLFLRSELRPGSIGAVSLSPMVLPIYRALGFRLGRMEQWYRPGGSPEGGRRILSGAVPRPIPLPAPDRSLTILDLDERELDRRQELVESILLGPTRPRKSVEYLRNRYLRHPVYRYELRLALRDDRPLGLAVLRRVEAFGSSAFRVVDAIPMPSGELSFLGPLADRELERGGGEYVDFLTSSSDPSLEAGGFSRLDLSGEPVVPNHFEPFERRNIVLDLAFWTREPGPYRLVKGDSDQDRPSLLPDEAKS